MNLQMPLFDILHALPKFTPRCVQVMLNSSKNMSWGLQVSLFAANPSKTLRTQLVAASCSSRHKEEPSIGVQQAAVDIQYIMGHRLIMMTQHHEQQSSQDSAEQQSPQRARSHQRQQHQHHTHCKMPASAGREDCQSQHAAPQHAVSSTDELVTSAIAKLGRFLQFRERCASEVLHKLQSLGYSMQQSQQVLGALQQAGLQSDARFADMYVRGYWRTKAYSPSRLAYELRSRGVEQQHIQAALSGVFGDRQHLPAEALSREEEDAWHHLVEVCTQQANLSAGQPQAKRKQKLAQWLQRRGHSMSTVFRIFAAVGL